MNLGNFETVQNLPHYLQVGVFGVIAVLIVAFLLAQYSASKANAKAELERSKREATEVEAAGLREENNSLSLGIDDLERNFESLGKQHAELQRKLRDAGKS